MMQLAFSTAKIQSSEFKRAREGGCWTDRSDTSKRLWLTVSFFHMKV